MNWEIKFWELAKYLIKKGYGADCLTKDLDDMEGLTYNSDARCGSCRAKDMCDWIDQHIDLLKF